MLVIESSVSLMQGIPQQQGSGKIACRVLSREITVKSVLFDLQREQRNRVT
jgi:hypothetical protein